VSRWVDIAALRLAIEEETAALAREAGIEAPHVEVAIELPDASGQRRIQVVVAAGPFAHMGPWEDN
jgi:hypothetical protein